ncbi:MAG: hypothetical protein EXR92_01175 [Gemmatimonadetes bacterium]|nr:hypothetical protein [Gemmatimonadota bacterium]
MIPPLDIPTTLSVNFPKLSLFLTNGAAGTFTGSWTQGGSSNEVVNGSYQDGVVRFTLVGFQGGSPTFVGALTHRYRISGTLELDELDGPAVFRRSSFTVPD